MRERTLSIVAAFALAGCGGGGGEPLTPAATSTAAAKGLWEGTTSNNRTVAGLVFDDGSFYVLYSVAGNPNLIGGVVQGGGTVSGSTFTSTNARDFNVEGLSVVAATVTATPVARQSFNGSVTSPGRSAVTFTTTYNAAYEQTPSLATLAGTYSGQVALSAGVQTATVTVASSGAVSGNGQGCLFSGTVVPRSDANAFNVTVTFGAAPCFFVGQTFSGIAYYNATARRLYAAAPNAARTDGVLFIGTKP